MSAAPPPPQARGGQRLLGCLTKLKAVGVAVVVSRVYGGQHLGKARSIGQGCGEAAMSAVSDGSALAVAVFTRFSHLAAFTHAALIHPDRRASSTSVLPRASCSRRSATSPEPASITSGAADRRSAARPVRSRRRRPTARPRLPPAARGSERAWTQRRLRRRRRRPSVPCSRSALAVKLSLKYDPLQYKKEQKHKNRPPFTQRSHNIIGLSHDEKS